MAPRQSRNYILVISLIELIEVRVCPGNDSLAVLSHYRHAPQIIAQLNVIAWDRNSGGGLGTWWPWIFFLLCPLFATLSYAITILTRYLVSPQEGNGRLTKNQHLLANEGNVLFIRMTTFIDFRSFKSYKLQDA